jgi:hypothetical protein
MPVFALMAAILAAPTPPAAPAVGGPYEPVEIAGPEIVVEGPAPRADAWTIQPDPRLRRRYAPPPAQSRNRLILRF